jgi:hypothetical protein
VICYSIVWTDPSDMVKEEYKNAFFSFIGGYSQMTKISLLFWHFRRISEDSLVLSKKTIEPRQWALIRYRRKYINSWVINAFISYNYW